MKLQVQPFPDSPSEPLDVMSSTALASRVALVTGAASGLGRATAERFIRQGARVILCDLPSSDGVQVARELGTNCHFSPTDVR